MDGETIALLIKWGPIALVAVIFLWFFLIGVIRGSYKVTRRLIYVVAYIVLLWFFMGTITNTILDLNVTVNGIKGVRNFIVHTIESNETINAFLSYSPNLKGLIIESPQIIVNPILFIILVFVGLPLSFPIYWIYLIIYNMIAKHVFNRRKYEVDENGRILRNDKGKKIKVKRKKHRLLGGLLRGAQAVVTFSIILLPVNFINRIYNKAKSNAEISTGENFCDTNSTLEKYREICGYIDMYNDTIFGKLGGEKSLDKIINDRLTTVKYNDKKVNLENELSTVVISAVLLNESGILDLFKDGKFNLEEADFTLIKFDKLDKLVDTLFSSTLISEVSDAGLKYVMHEVAEDKLIDLLKDDDIVSKIEYKNAGEIKQELKDVISILKFSVEKGLIDKAIDNKDNAINIVNTVNEDDVESLVNKILSLKILNRAMPSALSAYGEKVGITAPETMTDELNSEVASLLSTAVKFVKTMEITDMDSLTEGDLLDTLSNALFENGAMKDSSRESLATLLHDLNSSYLFKNVLSTQINNMLEDKDYKVDGRVLKYVTSVEDWEKELAVLDNVYALYDQYEEEEVVEYSNVTALLNDMKDTKVMISILPFAYGEILPQMGIEINNDSMPEIDFGSEGEEADKEEFYEYWGHELEVLSNIAEAIEVLELQSLEDVDVEMLKNDVKVDALSTIMGSVYESSLLKEPFVEMMVETINEFVSDFDVEFDAEELEVINTKALWKNEFTNIANVLDIDLSEEDSINRENLEIVFDSIGNMKLFSKKKIEILKYAINESGLLEDDELDAIDWPDENDGAAIDAFWEKETGLLLNIVDKKDTIEDLGNIDLDEGFDADEIGELLNDAVASEILSPTVISKIKTLLTDNGVRDDRDEIDDDQYLEQDIRNVNDWAKELESVKEIINIDFDNISEVKPGESKNAIEKMFDIIENSELLQNTRASLLLKAVDEIEIDGFTRSDDINALTLRGGIDGDYAKYNVEKNVIIEVSKSKEAFDDLSEGNMDFATMEEEKINEIGGLLDAVTESMIFEDYTVSKISEVLTSESNGVKDDRDQNDDYYYLNQDIRLVSNWAGELKSIQEIINIDYDNMSEVKPGESKNAIEKMFDLIENSALLQNTRATLLLKAINTIELDGFEVPSDVDAITLRGGLEGNYTKYNDEKNVIIEVSKSKDAFDDLSEGNMDFATMEEEKINEIGGLLDAVTESMIFEDYAVGKISEVLTSEANGVKDDRDQNDDYYYLNQDIRLVSNWAGELKSIQEIINIDYDNMSEVKPGESKNAIEKMFDLIENSALLQNTRATLLLKAINTIELDGFEVPSDVDAITLRGGLEGNYTKYNAEKNVLVKVSKNKNAFDDLSEGNMDFATMEEEKINEIGGLLDAVTKSMIFEDYTATKISEVLTSEANGVKDDRDQEGDYYYLNQDIKLVSDWTGELKSIQEIINIDYDNMSEVKPGESKNAIEKMFDLIENSVLLQNTRATLLLKAINTIELDGFEVPSDVDAITLRGGIDGDYTKYNGEKNVLIKVSKNKDSFDDLANGAMALASINTSEVGGLLNTVTDSMIFEGYVANKIVDLLDDNDIRDDAGKEDNLRGNISLINTNNGWIIELDIIQDMLTMTDTSFNEVDGVSGKTQVEIMFDNIENSLLLGDCRASILIKAITTIGLTDVQVPNTVTASSLRGTGDYAKYNNEKNVFITFAENKDAVEDLSDITELTGDSKRAMGSVLDAMKVSEILKVKYNKTLDTALASIRNNEYLVDYGVRFSNDYSSIIWSSTYDNDGVTVIKNGEIDNLLVIKDNIESVAGYVPEDLLTMKEEVINKIGVTLDAVSDSALLGEEQADKIADTVIATLTVNVITNITKDSNKTWTQAFDDALRYY